MNDNPIVLLNKELERRKDEVQKLAPVGWDVQRMFKAVVAVVARTPTLLECSLDSIIRCSIQAAEIGIVPSGALGGAYLVPYKGQATLIIGYRGLIELARRSGQISKIEARVVYEGDDFHVRYGTDSAIEHMPRPQTTGTLIAVYAVATLSDGAKQFEVMTKVDVDRIRARSRSGDKGPWETDYNEMARKTVVRRLCKYLPLRAEDAAGLETVENEEFIDVPPVPQERAPSGMEKLKQQLAADEEPPPPEEPGANDE